MSVSRKYLLNAYDVRAILLPGDKIIFPPLFPLIENRLIATVLCCGQKSQSKLVSDINDYHYTNILCV